MTLYYLCPLNGLFESAVCTTCAIVDNMIDCNDPSLTYYVLWKLTNTLSPPRFVISGGYFCSLSQSDVCTVRVTSNLNFPAGLPRWEFANGCMAGCYFQFITPLPIPPSSHHTHCIECSYTLHCDSMIPCKWRLRTTLL